MVKQFPCVLGDGCNRYTDEDLTFLQFESGKTSFYNILTCSGWAVVYGQTGELFSRNESATGVLSV